MSCTRRVLLALVLARVALAFYDDYDDQPFGEKYTNDGECRSRRFWWEKF
jgi:hypothetical protein